MNTLQVLLEQIPAFLHPEVKAIADNTLHLQNSLQVCVVGEFSTGKSSLINALLGAALLPTAREETTALPTFISYAPQLQFELINTDRTSTVISQTQFEQYTVAAPDNALCSSLLYPAEWLTDITLIDLPGLGSQSQRHSEYTHAQISAADTIIYLVSPRGPSQGDLNLLRLIKQYGKHLMIAVAQWDSIEQSIQEGEQAPNLNEWQAKIAQETGVDLVLIGVSKYGYGRDEVIGFLQETKQCVHLIREQRFYAELEPLLNNSLGALKAEQTVCAASGVEETQALQTELLSQRQTLLGIKSDLYARSNQDQHQLEQQAEHIIAEKRTQLATGLNDLSPATREDDWPVFTEAAYQQLKTQVLVTADDLKALSGNYGQLNLPDLDIQQFNLRLPSPIKIELDNFLDTSRLSLLQVELEQKQQMADSELTKINSLPVVNIEGTLQQISELRAERNTISQQELPRISPDQIGGEDGALLGKTIGNALDVAFIVFEGPAVILKALSMLGKTTKVIQTAGKLLPVINDPRLGFLEKLSFSYWGEQLGRHYDQNTQGLGRIDPQVEAERSRLLQENEKQIAAQRAELQRLEDLKQQRDYSSWALEQNQKEQQRLNANIQALQAKAEVSHREAEAEAIRQQQALFDSYRQQIIKQSLVHFDQQTRPMVDLLRTTCKRYWQEQVESTLAQRLQAIDSLNQQLQQAPEQKQLTLTVLQDQETQLQTVLNYLREGRYVA